jgi:hypothetical protein
VKSVMRILEDLKKPTMLCGDAGVHYEVWHRCKHVDVLRGCFVQVIQQDLAVRQWDKTQASKTRLSRLNVNVVCRIRAIESAFWVPVAQLLGKSSVDVLTVATAWRSYEFVSYQGSDGSSPHEATHLCTVLQRQSPDAIKKCVQVGHESLSDDVFRFR